MTEQEIMDKLGLKPWAEFRSGRTTHMLVHALVYVSSSPEAVAVIRGYRQRYTDDLVRKAQLMATRCGICSERIKSYKGDVRGECVCRLFEDHYRP